MYQELRKEKYKPIYELQEAMKLRVHSTKYQLDHGAVSKKVLARNTTSLGQGYTKQAYSLTWQYKVHKCTE